MKDPRTWIIVILATMVLFFALKADQPDPDPDAGLKTDELLERVRAAGFFVYAVNPVEGMQAMIEGLEGDTTRLADSVRELERQARVLDGRMQGVVIAYQNIRAELEVSQARVVELQADGVTPERVEDPIVDPTFSGKLVYNYTPMDFKGTQIGASIRSAFTVTEGADGRMIFGIVPDDPRVFIEFEGASWSPPPAEQVCTWGERGRAAAVGVGAVGVVGLIAALLGG